MAVCAAIILALAGAGSAQASFIGYYNPSGWTLTTNGGSGSVVTSDAPNSITLWGSNSGGGSRNTDYIITAPAAGNWSFDWYITNNDWMSGMDYGYWGLNGSFTSLGTTNGSSGSVGPVPINPGDLIGFRVGCSDCIFGALGLRISNFSAPEAGDAIPEPGTVSLVALGVIGIVASRFCRRRG